jgi:hypothetical protein
MFTSAGYFPENLYSLLRHLHTGLLEGLPKPPHPGLEFTLINSYGVTPI